MKVIKRKALGIMSKVINKTDSVSLAKTRNKMLIAAKIADALKTKGLTQKAFAIQMEKTESEVSEWLSGNRNFQLDTLTEIEECLGINLIDTQKLGVPVYNNLVVIQIRKKTETFMSNAKMWGQLDNQYITTSKVG